jgi:hypothetical protein
MANGYTKLQPAPPPTRADFIKEVILSSEYDSVRYFPISRQIDFLHGKGFDVNQWEAYPLIFACMDDVLEAREKIRERGFFIDKW